MEQRLPSPANLPVDSCRCWHGDWADVGASLRYAVLDGPVGLTAAVSAGVPTTTSGRARPWPDAACVNCALARVDVFLAYQEFVQGTDTHAGRAITTGVSVAFRR